MLRKTLNLYLTASIMVTSAFALEKDYQVADAQFELDGKSYASKIVSPTDASNLPSVFMIPNWMGVTDGSVEKAKRVSNGQYVVYIADVYGSDLRPADATEAGQAAGALRADRMEMRKRGNAALTHFRSLAAKHGGNAKHIAAIGFCFGGGAVLEMARSGTDARAFVSFHGDLVSPTLDADAEKIQGKILVLHGAADPLVPQDHVNAFESAMGKTRVDWTLISYGGAVHSFTDPTAAMAGTAMYCERTARRAFREMWALFDETFAE